MDIDIGQLPRYVNAGPLIVYVPETVGSEEAIHEEYIPTSQEMYERRIAEFEAMRKKKPAAAPAKAPAKPATASGLGSVFTALTKVDRRLLYAGLGIFGFIAAFAWSRYRAGERTGR